MEQSKRPVAREVMANQGLTQLSRAPLVELYLQYTVLVNYRILNITWRTHVILQLLVLMYLGREKNLSKTKCVVGVLIHISEIRGLCLMIFPLKYIRGKIILI